MHLPGSGRKEGWGVFLSARAGLGRKHRRIGNVTREPPAGIGSLLADGNYLRIWLMGGLAGASRWLEMLALGIYAVEVTGSPLLVALLMILRLAPLALFGVVIGTLADRADRKLVVIVSLVLVFALSVVMLATTTRRPGHPRRCGARRPSGAGGAGAVLAARNEARTRRSAPDPQGGLT